MTNDLLNSFIKKCDDNKLKHTIFKDPEGNDHIEFDIQGGRKSYKCSYDFDKLDLLVKSNFEFYNFINNYEAIWSSIYKTIECELNPLSSRNYQSRMFPRRFFIRQIGDCLKRNGTDDFTIDNADNYDQNIEVNLPSINGINLSLGPCSTEFAILASGRLGGYGDIDAIKQMRSTLKISNIDIDKHDEACLNLQNIGNSVLFNIDLLFDIPVMLTYERESLMERRKRLRKVYRRNGGVQVIEPKYQYDNDPLSIYWYAKSIPELPLIKFQAFYQTIEYYFPIFSQKVAQERIQDCIKDPRFNVNSEADISKLLNLIKVSRDGSLLGNEMTQLTACIRACTDDNDLKKFFESDERKLKFFNDKASLTISKNKINISGDNIVEDVARRIYDIRCKIVHRKSDEDDVINPFSNEAKMLMYDTDLVEFIARKMLIKNSKPISIHKI